MSPVNVEELAEKADLLLRAHAAERPLLLPNVWDAASAVEVAAAGFPAVATSSRAVAQVLGEADDDTSDPDLVFSFTARIARAVSLPVTADLEAGFRLQPAELVDRMLDAGVVGCNLEDTDHHGGGLLVDADQHAAYVAEVRAAGDRLGVHLVLNARVDTFIRHVGEHAEQVGEAVRRARLYFEAGADCVYPMAVSDVEDISTLIASTAGPMNFMARRGGLSIGTLTALGARRISLASGVFGLLTARHREILQGIAEGRSLDEL